MSRKIYFSPSNINFIIIIFYITLVYWFLLLLLLLDLNKVVLYISPCSDVAIFPMSAVFASACNLTLTFLPISEGVTLISGLAIINLFMSEFTVI